MDSSSPSSHGWHSYADKFSTLESANPPQPGHLSLEAASSYRNEDQAAQLGHLSLEAAAPYRNVDDTVEGKEVWQVESERQDAACIGGRRLYGMSAKTIVIMGVILLLVAVGGIAGGVLGNRKGRSALVAATDTPTSTQQSSQSSLLSSKTPIVIVTTTTSDTSRGVPSTTVDALSLGGISMASNAATETTSTTVDAKNAKSTTPETTATPDTASVNINTESPPITTISPPPSTTSLKNPPSESSSSPSSFPTTLGLGALFAPNKFYTFKGTNGWYIRAVDRGSIPGTWSVTAEPQSASSPLPLQIYWQILAIPANNSLSASIRSSLGTMQIYWISNRYYGPNRRLTLTDEEWAEAGRKSVMAIPPRTKDEEDRGQYWYFKFAGALFRMYNLKSEEGFRVVMSPEGGLGLAGAEVLNGGGAGSAGTFDEWIVEGKEEIRKGMDGFQWVTDSEA